MLNKPIIDNHVSTEISELQKQVTNLNYSNPTSTIYNTLEINLQYWYLNYVKYEEIYIARSNYFLNNTSILSISSGYD